MRALLGLIRLIRRLRPDIVETHTAKAGVLGRVAAVLALRPRPAIVHCYHGHVLTGYFSTPVTAVYRTIERVLARVSDRLVCVSEATKDELVGLRVGREGTLPGDPPRPGPGSASWSPSRRGSRGSAASSAEPNEQSVLAGFVGRLVPIKRVDVLLDAVAEVRARVPALRLAIVGDGPLRGELESQSRRLGLDDIVRFAGYRRDMDAVVGALDIGVLPSDNEGTPVALIEAGAGGRCVTATRWAVYPRS